MVGTCALALGPKECDVIDYTHSAAVTAWTPIYTETSGVLIPQKSADASVEVTYYMTGRFQFHIADGITVAQGDFLYYNITNGDVSTTVPVTYDGFYLGQAAQAGTATAGYVEVEVKKLNKIVVNNFSTSASTGTAAVKFTTTLTCNGATTASSRALECKLVVSSRTEMTSGQYAGALLCTFAMKGTMTNANAYSALIQLDLTAGTWTAGQLSALWVDCGGSAGVDGGTYGDQFNIIKITNTTLAVPNAVFKITAKASYLFDLRQAGGFGAYPGWLVNEVCGGLAERKIKISVFGTVGYIPIYAS